MQNPERNYHMDNVKFWLVSLVLIVHFISPNGGDFVYDSEFVKNVFIFIMLFIMPAFAMVSGYFSKAELTRDDIKKYIIHLIIPYLIFQTIFILASQNITTESYLEPLYYLWYLPALFAWRLMLPVFVNFRFSILLVVFISIVVGYNSQVSYFLTLSRIFYFFPYFLIGYLIKSKNYDYTNKTVIASWIVLLLILVAIFVISPPVPQQKWVLGSYPYASLGCPSWMCGLVRLALYPLTLIAIFAFLFIVPRKETIFSALGAHSIYPYMLQGFILFALLQTGLYHQPSLLTQILLIPAGFVCTLLLSSAICRRIFKFIIQPNYLAKLIFK